MRKINFKWLDLTGLSLIAIVFLGSRLTDAVQIETETLSVSTTRFQSIGERLGLEGEFYPFLDPIHSIQTTFVYKVDSKDVLPAFRQTEDNEGITHRLSLNLSQGLTENYRGIVRLGFQSNNLFNAFQTGVGIQADYFEGNSVLGFFYQRGKTFEEPQPFVSNNLEPAFTSLNPENNSFELSYQQILTSTLKISFIENLSTGDDMPDLFRSGVHLSEWLPWEAALHLNYDYFHTYGSSPSTSSLQSLSAHIASGEIFQYLGRATIVGVGYRYYRDEQNLPHSVKDQIGSDFVRFHLRQDLKRIFKISGVQDLYAKAEAGRYLNNDGLDAWYGGAQIGFTF